MSLKTVGVPDVQHDSWTSLAACCLAGPPCGRSVSAAATTTPTVQGLRSAHHCAGLKTDVMHLSTKKKSELDPSSWREEETRLREGGGRREAGRRRRSSCALVEDSVPVTFTLWSGEGVHAARTSAPPRAVRASCLSLPCPSHLSHLYDARTTDC